MICGDFNAKIGTVDGALRDTEELSDFLPLAAESEEVNEAGAEMLSLFSVLDFLRLPFTEQGVEQYTFIILPESETEAVGGSIIDNVFFSPCLLHCISCPMLRWDAESGQAGHLLLGWHFSCQFEPLAPQECSPRTNVTSFDVEKVLDLSLPEDLVQLATNPQAFTARSAYSTVLSFIRSYTKTTTVREKKDTCSRELRELRRKMRKIERSWRRDKFSEDGLKRGEELSRLARLFREKRDLEKAQEVEYVRKRYWEAVYSGQAHLAWKYAKSGLDGKGGGVKTSVTQGISRQRWEEHFGALLGGDAGQNLYEIRLGGVSVPSLDEPFTIEDV
jgi:hypothetical protein